MGQFHKTCTGEFKIKRNLIFISCKLPESSGQNSYFVDVLSNTFRKIFEGKVFGNFKQVFKLFFSNVELHYPTGCEPCKFFYHTSFSRLLKVCILNYSFLLSFL